MELTFNACEKLMTLCNYFDKAELGPPEIDGGSLTISQKRLISAAGISRLKKLGTKNGAPFDYTASTSLLTADLTKRGKQTYEHVRKMLRVAQIEMVTTRGSIATVWKDGDFKVFVSLTIRLHPGHKPIDLKFVNRK